MADFVLNREFRIVFQPKDPELYGKRRFAVGAGSLHKYIGQYNANKALSKAIESGMDKFTAKYRSFGRVDFYSK